MAAASDLYQKSHVQVLEQTSSVQQKPSKSCSNFLCKSLVIILVLVVIPLFPSQAPEFINQSLLTKFWELLHLLFIGIAVSYGLFCRKCVKMEIENFPINEPSHPYLSGILDVPSFFEDRSENFFISDEEKFMHDWNSEFLYGKSMGQESPAVSAVKMCRSFRNWGENICEVGRERLSEIWNSQHFQGESLVVVTDGNYIPDEHKPLGLPIRSLRSRIAYAEKPEFIGRNGHTSSLKDSINKNIKGKVEKIRGLVPTNLEKNFEEAAGPSTSPWRSRSWRMGMREEVRNAEPPCHSRPHSVGEFEFEHFQSRSFRHLAPSGTSLKSSASTMSTSLSSVSEEVSNLKTENLEIKKDLQGSYDTISHSTVENLTGGASFATTKARAFSIGSYSELDMQGSSTNDFKNFNKGAMQDQIGSYSEREMQGSSKNDFKNFTKSAMQDQIGSNSELDMQGSSTNDFKNFNKGAMQDQIGSYSEREMQGSSKNDFKNFTKSVMQDQIGSNSELDIQGSSTNDFKNFNKGAMQDQIDSYSEREMQGSSKNDFRNFTKSAMQDQIGSNSELEMQGRSKNDFKNFSKNAMQDQLVRGKQSSDSLKSDARPSNLAKILSRAKSVRTIRSGRHVLDKMKKKEKYPSQINYEVGVMCGQYESPILVNTVKEGELKHPSVDNRKPNYDKVYPMPKSISSEYQNGEKQELADSGLASEEDSDRESVSDNFRESSDEKKIVSNEVDDAELGSEVDRKADEFIAKFRKQIRLQKVASAKRYG